MFVQPSGNHQCGDPAQEGAHLGQPNQLIVGWRRDRGDRRAVKAVVACPWQLVEFRTSGHPGTVACTAATFQGSGSLIQCQNRPLVTFCAARSICVANVLPFCDGIPEWFLRTHDFLSPHQPRHEPPAKDRGHDRCRHRHGVFRELGTIGN